MLSIINELRGTSSKLLKEVILRRHADNIEWKEYLLSVYNPFVTYGVTGDKNESQDDLENLKLCRSLNAGVTAVTINKVYPGLIPTASKMMKAYDYGKKPKPLNFPMYAGIKYDGNYVNIVVTPEDTRFYTSGGHEYSHWEVYLGLPAGFVYMAERIKGEGLLGDRRGCSLEGPKGSQFAKGENTYKIFDCVSLEDFELGSSSVPYQERRGRIPFEHAAGEIIINSIDDAEEWLDGLVSEGIEGLVLKSFDMKWRDSKSRRTDFVKWKKRQTADLLCIEEIEGEGNSKGIIGSLRLRDSLGREFNVGSGLSLNGDLPFGSYVGYVCEIEYEHINPAGTYIQPVVIGIRKDKEIDDID